MPRPICPEIPGHPLHLIQRGSLHRACFFCDEDCAAYLRRLGRYAGRFGCAVHAYVLMSNHVHLLLTPSHAGAATKLMRALAERYARHVGEAHPPDRALWEDRFDAIPVHVGPYVLSCMRYIELNPVRAHLAVHPGHYRWSSFAANALGQDDALVTPHSFYCALGRSAAARQAAYRALFLKTRSATRAAG